MICGSAGGVHRTRPSAAPPQHARRGRRPGRPSTQTPGVPARAGPEMCCAVSHVRVSGETTTRSNAVNARPPDGRSARYARRLSACAMPLGVAASPTAKTGAMGAGRARARARERRMCERGGPRRARGRDVRGARRCPTPAWPARLAAVEARVVAALLGRHVVEALGVADEVHLLRAVREEEAEAGFGRVEAVLEVVADHRALRALGLRVALRERRARHAAEARDACAARAQDDSRRRHLHEEDRRHRECRG